MKRIQSRSSHRSAPGRAAWRPRRVPTRRVKAHSFDLKPSGPEIAGFRAHVGPAPLRPGADGAAVAAPGLKGRRPRKSAPSGAMKSRRLAPKRVRDLEADLAAARSRVDAQANQIRLLREALKSVCAQRDAAELERARSTMKLRSWRDTILGGLVVRLEAFSARAPRLAAYAAAGLGLLGAVLTLRLRDHREKKRRSRALLDEDRALIMASGLFDAEYYLAKNPDISLKQDGLTALDHYVVHGADEGRNPNSAFDSFWYLATYPEVETTRRNPLAHYVHGGAGMEYAPNPGFDVSWYRMAHAAELRGGITPLQHFHGRPAHVKPATEAAIAILRDTERF